MVPVFAFGKGAEKFSGIYDNTEIFHKMMAAFGIKAEDK
jgi:alkaline phosphatase